MATRVPAAPAGRAGCAHSLVPKYIAAPRDSTPTIQVIGRFTIPSPLFGSTSPRPKAEKHPSVPLPPRLGSHPLRGFSEGWLVHKTDARVKPKAELQNAN